MKPKIHPEPLPETRRPLLLLREAFGPEVTQEQIADRMTGANGRPVNREYYTRLENGTRKGRSMVAIGRLAQAFGVSIDDMALFMNLSFEAQLSYIPTLRKRSTYRPDNVASQSRDNVIAQSTEAIASARLATPNEMASGNGGPADRSGRPRARVVSISERPAPRRRR